MIPFIRQRYNQAFTQEKYQKFINDMNNSFNYDIEFRIAETPVFIDKYFKQQLMEAADEIINVIQQDNFKEITEGAIPKNCFVPNENDHPHLIAIDFAIAEDENGFFIPQLIEMQGFASLYCYQEWLAEMYQKHFTLPAGFDNKFNNYKHQSYIERFKKVILGNHKKQNVVLLELDPWKQKTQIDFYCTQKYIGIPVVNLTDVIREGKNLFYLADGVKTPIHRIYNRVIFDELLQRKDLKLQFNMTEEVDVEWVAHPNWFFRISKYTMPLIKSKFVPETFFVKDLEAFPKDLENWVLKPLFSFSGQGVIFDVTQKDIDNITDPSNYILQRKVNYAPAVKSPTGNVKCEIRLLYLWNDGEAKPELALNLGRMSKGKMIGVRYNQDLDWVGATSCFLELDEQPPVIVKKEKPKFKRMK